MFHKTTTTAVFSLIFGGAVIWLAKELVSGWSSTLITLLAVLLLIDALVFLIRRAWGR